MSLKVSLICLYAGLKGAVRYQCIELTICLLKIDLFLGDIAEDGGLEPKVAYDLIEGHLPPPAPLPPTSRTVHSGFTAPLDNKIR